MQKVQLKTRLIKSGYTFTEEYEISNKVDGKQYANDLIDAFNATLRPNEEARELLEVVVNKD